MLSGGIGISSPGQFAPGAIAYFSQVGVPIPAPFDRTFVLPQAGLPWDGYKTPETSINFSFNWSAEIGEDLIVTSEWQLESDDIVQASDSVDSSATIATILISGGVSANIYNVTNLITTESGLQLDATFRLFVNPYNL